MDPVDPDPDPQYWSEPEALRKASSMCKLVVLCAECAVQAPHHHPEGHVPGGGQRHARVCLHRRGQSLDPEIEFNKRLEFVYTGEVSLTLHS